MLDEEIKLFQAKLPEFLKTHEGYFVLMKGDEVRFFRSQEDAITIGLELYGAKSGFLVRRITAQPEKPFMPPYSLGLINTRT